MSHDIMPNQNSFNHSGSLNSRNNDDKLNVNLKRPKTSTKRPPTGKKSAVFNGVKINELLNYS